MVTSVAVAAVLVVSGDSGDRVCCLAGTQVIVESPSGAHVDEQHARVVIHFEYSVLLCVQVGI